MNTEDNTLNCSLWIPAFCCISTLGYLGVQELRDKQPVMQEMQREYEETMKINERLSSKLEGSLLVRSLFLSFPPLLPPPPLSLSLSLHVFCFMPFCVSHFPIFSGMRKTPRGSRHSCAQFQPPQTREPSLRNQHQRSFSAGKFVSTDSNRPFLIFMTSTLRNVT